MAAAENPLTYNDFVAALGLMAVEKTQLNSSGVMEGVSADFTAQIPLALNYAEARIQRDCPFLQFTVANNGYSLIAGNNSLSLSVDDFVTVETISINGTPLLCVTKEYLQNVWGTNATLAQPQLFAMLGGDAATAGSTATNIIFGPWPDANYGLSITGMVRAPSLYKFANTTDAGTRVTFLSSQLPDVLLTAAMVWIGGYQRNFSSTGNDPQMPVNWEQQYGALMTGARMEEARKRFSASAWSSQAPQPATPGR